MARKKIELDITVRVVVESDYTIGELDIPEVVDEVCSDMDYSFEYSSGTIKITETEILDVEVTG
jgi:hypothetical protein